MFNNSLKKEALVEAKDAALQIRNEAEVEAKERRLEVQNSEKRLVQKEDAIDRKSANLEKKENALSQKATTTEAPKIEAQQDCSVTPKGQKPDTKKQVFTLPEMERAKNINSLLGACVRNYDDGHEGVIESIGDNGWVHVRGESTLTVYQSINF